MKTKLISLAATLLLAASVNTASAEYYLSGAFNNWNISEEYKFTNNTLTTTITNGPFKIVEKNNDNSVWYGPANSFGDYLFNKNTTSSTLAEATSIDFPSFKFNFYNLEYTFTITEENDTKTLSISNLDDLLIVGSFYNNWAPQRMTKQSDGSYTFDVALDEGAKFKIRDFNNTFWGASSNTETHQIKYEWHTNISLVASGEGINSKDFEIVHGGNFRVVVKDGKLSLLGYTAEFDDNMSYGPISNYQNQVYDVQLEGRTLVGGQWNTICLPFEVGNENGFGGTPLAGADVREFYDSSLDGGTLTLTFNEANSISPGVPYIVKPTSTVTNPIFTGVTIESGLAPVESDIVKFIGTFAPETINGQNYIYLGAESKLYWPQNVTIGAFRAYFQLAEGYTVGDPTASQGIKAFNLNFGDEETSIKQINNTESATDTYFTLDGRRLNDKPATAGLYIINGKKVVIK